MSDQTALDLYVAIGRREARVDMPSIANPPSHPAHWMLLVVPRHRTDRCVFIHVEGGPLDYFRSIDLEHSLESCGEQFKELIGSIDVSQLPQLLELADDVDPQRCQLYVVELLDRMHQKGLIRRAVVQNYRSMVEPSIWNQLMEAETDIPEAAKILLDLAEIYVRGRRGNMHDDVCLYDELLSDEGSLEFEVALAESYASRGVFR